MKRLCYILIFLMVFPQGVFAKVAIPNFTNWTTGYGVDNLNAYYGASNPTICVVTDLESNTDRTNLETCEVNGTSAKCGSFEECIDEYNDVNANMVILFEVGGTIDTDDQINILGYTDGTNPYSSNGLRIAGQTAPSPGITFKDTKLQVAARNVLIEHLRVRTGDDASLGADIGWSNLDAFNVGSKQSLGQWYHPKNVQIDHCSISWGCDENTGISTSYYATDATAAMTFSNCVFSEPLDEHNGAPVEGRNSKNVIIAYGDEIAIVDSIFANSVDRNPYIVYGDQQVVIANNTIWNAVSFPIIIEQDDNDNSIDVTAIGNYNYGGPDSGSAVTNYFVTFWDITSDAYEFESADGDTFYFDKNRCDADTQANSDDWDGVREATAQYANAAALKSAITETNNAPYTPDAAATAHAANLDNAGARPMDRDTVDIRIISQISTNDQSADATVDHPSDVGGWPDCPAGVCAAATDWDDNTSTASIGLGTELTSFPNTTTHLNNFPSDPHAVISGGTYDGYTNLEKWLDELADYWETGVFPGENTGNDYVDDPNCIGAYMVASTALLNGQDLENYALSDAAGETAWVTQSTSNGVSYVGASVNHYYECIAITDAAGLTLSKIDIYPDNAGSLSGKTLSVYKNTQTAGAGSNLTGVPGTLIGTLTGDDAFDYTAETIDVTDTAFAENDLLCFSMGEVDTADYFKLKRNSDSEAKLGDIQQFTSAGVHAATNDQDFKIILYTSAGAPPSYINGIADFDGTDDHLWQAITSLHANTPGRTGKTTFAFVLESIDFDAFPTDGNEFTLLKIANVLDCYVKTSGTDNLLEMKLFDGTDWYTYTHASDLAADTEYDIEFGWDNATNTAVIDVGTSADNLRLGTRIASTANDFNLNAPNSGNLYIGSADGSGEFFNGTVDALTMWDAVPSADDFINILENDYGDPLPTMTALTFTPASYDSTDIDTWITAVATFSQGVNFNNVYWPMETGSPDMVCSLAEGATDATPNVICQLLSGMRTAALACADTDMTVGGSLKDLAGLDATTLTLPAVTGAVDISIPYTTSDPCELGTGGDYADWATFAAALIANDSFKQLEDLSETVTLDEAGVSWDGNGFGVDRMIVTGANCTIRMKAK